MNKCYNMNMLSKFRAPLATLERLSGLEIVLGDSEVALKDRQKVDALITIRSCSGSGEYAVHAKRGVTTTTLPAILTTIERAQSQVGRPPLLLSDYLTPAVTEKLLAEHVEFVDGAGNIFLDSPAAYVLVLNKKPKLKQYTSGFTATDLKLIYALLSMPQLRGATYRDLSATTGISLGKISATLNQLEEADYLFRGKNGALLLQDPTHLLERWEYGYLEQLRPTLNPSGWHLSKNATLKGVLAEASKVPGVLVGGEVAADEFTHYLKPATLTLHVPRDKTKATAARLRLAPSDGDADVTMLERFGPPAGYGEAQALDQFRGDNPRNLAHPILVRAELLALDDSRLREVAGRLLDAVILPELTAMNV